MVVDVVRGERVRAWRAAWLVFFVLCFAALPASAEDDPPPEPITVEVGENKIHLGTPPWAFMRCKRDCDEQLKAWWVGVIGKSDVEVELRIFPREEYRLHDPEAVADYAIYAYQDPKREDPRFGFQTRELVEGPYGHIPLGSVCAGLLPCAAKPEGEMLMLGGILETHGYELSVIAKPALYQKDRKAVLDYFRKGFKAEAKLQNTQWSKEEALARWEKDVKDPKVRKKLKKPVRTKHYIIFTNSGAGKLFAKKMESCYKQIQKVFPFEEVEGRKLMPVFVFRSREEYYAFCSTVVGWSHAQAANTKGHAWRDYYATYYESPNDPVHIHEATHQIFMNRLFLTGGGSWFQEGVAEYICTKPGERKAFAKGAARRQEFTDFETFVKIDSLVHDGSTDSNKAYLQAASIIEFLREDRALKKKFQTFIHRMGLVPDNNVEAIEQVLKELYDCDLEGLQAGWQAYWKKR